MTKLLVFQISHEKANLAVICNQAVKWFMQCTIVSFIYLITYHSFQCDVFIARLTVKQYIVLQT